MAAKNLNIKFKKAVATVYSLKAALSSGTAFVHVSCHGETKDNLEAKMGQLFYKTYSHQGDILLLEDEVGNSYPLSLTNLFNLL